MYVPAGKELDVTLEIPVSSLAYYDETAKKRVVTPGTYKMMAGSSVQDIRATAEIVVK